MKTIKVYFRFTIVAALLAFLVGCGGTGDEPAQPSAELTAVTDDGGESVGESVGESGEKAAFSYSDGLDENGFWSGITATDYVELYDYDAFTVPKETHDVADDEVQTYVDDILNYYSTAEQVTTRPVSDGDTVNIDYVGSVDGVEFDGGSTGGAGTEVTIGVTSYIDDFLEQIIGRNPGETFDINVTFPEDYGVDNLNGQDAVFVTTVNYIVERVKPELDDAFVSEHLSSDYGWTTITEMKDGIYADIKKEAVQNYIYGHLSSGVSVKSVPDNLIKYQEDAMLNYYREGADSYGLALDEFLSTYVGVSSTEELIETNAEGNADAARFSLVVQAIAEDAKITVSEADISDYFEKQTGGADYSQYEEAYGMPYLKQAVLTQKVMDYLSEHAVLG
jgi:trigger factor